MGGGAPGLRELEQLRVLAMYEFDPPLSSQELVGALRACDNRTHEAYSLLKNSRQTISVPASAPTMSSSPEREREKRRMSQPDEAHTPSKKPKRLSLEPLEDEKMEEDTPPESQQPVGAADCAHAQQLLLQTVEDRVLGQHPPRNEDWINETWKALQVPTELELAMQLNLTVDALAKWVKLAAAQDAQGVQTRGAALTVEVLASLPPRTTGDAVTCTPKDEELALHDEEVATRMQMLANAAEKNAFERSNAAKSAIGCVSTTCAAYIERLRWVAGAGERKNGQSDAARTALETLSQKLMGLLEQSSRDVKQAELALQDAKRVKETRSKQIIDFVKRRHEELVAAGETEASASLQSVVEVWKADDVEVQALWNSRDKSGERVQTADRELKTANSALTYHQNLSILFRKVRSRREKALKRVSEVFGDVCSRSETRAAAALAQYIPMLTNALLRYYEFHSIRQAKAKEEQAEQEKALEAHVEYFGDSAPIKKNDIEQRIREFIGVKQSSMQEIMEIAEGQRKLWEDNEVALPVEVRRVLAREFKGLWQQLSGPMQDVMSKFVAAIEKASGGVIAVEPQQEPSPVIVSATSLDERVIPPFTLPVFTSNHADVVTPYRTATSAIVASNDEGSDAGTKVACEPSEPSEKSPTSGWVDVPASGAEARVPTPPPQSPEGAREFPDGAVVYSKMAVGESCTQFVRGVVEKQLENGMYMVHYDNGDKFSVGSSFLFTKDLMEQHLKAGGAAAPDQDTEMEDTEQTGRCSIM